MTKNPMIIIKVPNAANHVITKPLKIISYKKDVGMEKAPPGTVAAPALQKVDAVIEMDCEFKIYANKRCVFAFCVKQTHQ